MSRDTLHCEATDSATRDAGACLSLTIFSRSTLSSLSLLCPFDQSNGAVSCLARHGTALLFEVTGSPNITAGAILA